MCPLFRTKLSHYHVRWIVSFSSTMRCFLIMHVASSWTRGEIHFLKCLKIHHMDESSSPIPTISTAQSEKIFIINNWVKSKNNFHCPVHLARACWSFVVDCQPTSSLDYTNKHIGSMSDDFSFRRCSLAQTMINSVHAAFDACCFSRLIDSDGCAVGNREIESGISLRSRIMRRWCVWLISGTLFGRIAIIGNFPFN